MYNAFTNVHLYAVDGMYLNIVRCCKHDVFKYNAITTTVIRDDISEDIKMIVTD